MKKVCGLCFLVIIFSVMFVCPALADPSASTATSGDEIWTKLADKASLIGFGLKKSGYIIAGIGLIFFSFMAVFNKISWKNLAYIMLSCFVLSVMVGLINYFSTKDANPEYSSETTFNGPDGNTSFKGGVPAAGGTNPG